MSFFFLSNGRYAGERDKFGRIHGRGTVYFPNGRKFVGSFSHGARCGGGELFEKVVADDFTLTERDCTLFMRQICQVGH